MGNKGCYVINKGSLPFTSQHFRSVQFRSISRNQIQGDLNHENLLGLGTKHCGKNRENSGFPHCFYRNTLTRSLQVGTVLCRVNPLPHKPILGRPIQQQRKI